MASIKIDLRVPMELDEIQIHLPGEDGWPAVGPKMIRLETGWSRDYSVQAGGPAKVTVLHASKKRKDRKNRMVIIQFEGDNIKKVAYRPVVMCT